MCLDLPIYEHTHTQTHRNTCTHIHTHARTHTNTLVHVCRSGCISRWWHFSAHMVTQPWLQFDAAWTIMADMELIKAGGELASCQTAACSCSNICSSSLSAIVFAISPQTSSINTFSNPPPPPNDLQLNHLNIHHSESPEEAWAQHREGERSADFMYSGSFFMAQWRPHANAKQQSQCLLLLSLTASLNQHPKAQKPS